MELNADYLIVGAGFSGLVLAERIVSVLGKSVLVVDRRNHIGGNCHDFYDDAGVLIHPYGPHYFRTNSDRIVDYLSKFTDWKPVNYQIKSYTNGKYWSFPINLNTFEELTGRPSTEQEFSDWLAKERVNILNPSNSEEIITSQVGVRLYKMFFEGYTRKQWQKHPKELDPSVCGRIPIRTDRNDNYLAEKFQALPAEGYHVLFQNMVTSMGNKLKLLLNTDFQDVRESAEYKYLIFTGPIDAYYDFCHGSLPYRSLEFKRESFDEEALRERQPVSGKKGFWQPALQVNYPNDHSYTRIVEMKHATGQEIPNTTIVKEYPRTHSMHNEPFYPIPSSDASEIYRKYKAMADMENKVSFVGRLARYQYLNMDQVVGMALKEFERIAARNA